MLNTTHVRVRAHTHMHTTQTETTHTKYLRILASGKVEKGILLVTEGDKEQFIFILLKIHLPKIIVTATTIIS